MNESARGRVTRDEPVRTITATGAPWYGDTWGFTPRATSKTIIMPDKDNYIVIEMAGKPHLCNWNKREMYRHEQSSEDKSIFNYVSTGDSIDDCQACQESKAKAIENARIRKEEEDFQNTIEVVSELNDDNISYEWATAQVGKSPDGRLWYRYGAGCSCNSIYDEQWLPFTEANQLHTASRHISNAGNRARFIGYGQGLLSGI